LEYLYWAGIIIGTYLGIGLLFTTGVAVYHKLTNRFTGGGFFGGIVPDWLVFIVAVVIFPLNIYLHIRNWRWGRLEKKRQQEHFKSKGWL